MMNYGRRTFNGCAQQAADLSNRFPYQAKSKDLNKVISAPARPIQLEEEKGDKDQLH